MYRKKLVEKELPDEEIMKRITRRRQRNTKLYRNKRLLKRAETNRDPAKQKDPIIWTACGPESMFDMTPRGAPEGTPPERWTVEQYMRQRHNVQLRFPHMPMIFLKDGRDEGFYPLEFIFQAFGKLKGTDNNAHVLRFNDEFASTKRLDHLEMIKRHAEQVQRDSGQELSTLLRQFNLEASPEPLTLTATVLQQPVIHFHSRHAFPRDGSWDLRNIRFPKPATMTSFAILDFAGGQNLSAFEFLFKIMEGHGMDMPRNVNISEAINSLTVRAESIEPARVSKLCTFPDFEKSISCSNRPQKYCRCTIVSMKHWNARRVSFFSTRVTNSKLCHSSLML